MVAGDKVKSAGAIVLDAVSEEYIHPCRIIGIIWEGTTTSGDRVLIRGRGGSATAVLWATRTDTTETYIGAIWGAPGVNAPDGFRAEALTAGTVYVYLSE